jgi:hypothetical protein
MSPFVVRVAAPLCLLMLPTSLLAETFVLTGSVNLRTGPGIGYARMTTLPQGTLVHVHSCLPSHSWCNVSYGHISGWASGRYMAAMVPVAPYVGAYSGAVTHYPPAYPTAYPPVYPTAGVVVTGPVPVIHAPPPQPSVIVHSHTARYPGRVVRYQQVVTNQPVVSYSWPHPHAVGHVGFFPVDLQ